MICLQYQNDKSVLPIVVRVTLIDELNKQRNRTVAMAAKQRMLTGMFAISGLDQGRGHSSFSSFSKFFI